ncbi:MAG TPA: biopolymer transporter ExbD [Longimicrobiales bacterium]|nr:biopolymer transporter ExbD [Longimicrobiales bacterium]
MSMSTGGGKGGPSWQINMTPMIDVLLVLLIIFMVIQPTLQKGIEVQVPPVDEQPSESTPDQITLEIRTGPDYLINGMPVPAAELRAQISGIFAERPRKVLFIKGAEDIRYGDVVRAVDAARGAGIEVVGLVPRGS